MVPEDLLREYERALASQDWETVEPLIHEDACATFSTGSVHKGKSEIEQAFRSNFAAIESEEYAISGVHWVWKGATVAVALFDFRWRGRVQGKAMDGAGRGTAVLVRDDDRWRLLVEHLGPGP